MTKNNILDNVYNICNGRVLSNPARGILATDTLVAPVTYNGFVYPEIQLTRMVEGFFRTYVIPPKLGALEYYEFPRHLRGYVGFLVRRSDVLYIDVCDDHE